MSNERIEAAACQCWAGRSPNHAGHCCADRTGLWCPQSEGQALIAALNGDADV